MAAVMQAPRPSMDRSASFDQARRAAPTFPSASASTRPSLSQTPSHSSHHRHSFTNPTLPHASIQNQNQNQNHSRSSSSASRERPGSVKSIPSSPYQQPYPTAHHSYFPQGQNHPIPQQALGYPQHQQPQQQQAWTTAALPASAFYAAPFHHAYPGGNQVFHQGFQQSQANFAAWANAYQHMVMASVPEQPQPQPQPHNPGPGQGHEWQWQQQHGMFAPPPPAEYLVEERPRSVSSPSSPYDRPQSPPHLGLPIPTPQSQTQTQTQGKPPAQAFHPYKRQPGHKPSRENMNMSRSVSQPIISSSSSANQRTAPSPLASASSQDHVRNASFDSKPLPTPTAAVAPAPAPLARRAERSSESSERERPIAKTYASATTGSHTASAAAAASPVARTPTPLHTGPIANATNTPPSSRPSPLSNSVSPAPEPEKKGLKGRFKKALGGDSKKSTPPSASAVVPPASTPAPVTFTSPSVSSTRSGTPPITPQQQQHYTHDVPLNPPSAPFAVSNQGAMGSDVSLAETERTTTTLTGGPGEGKEKKRSMFRMKNMSTDNISLSSTVSSASMMIRRMGSLGKLARRNSLAGISKIFKDKPKDEDAALPGKEVKMDKKELKKQAKQDKKDRKKAQAAPATVSHTTAEQDRTSHSNGFGGNDDDDRTLAGLSPAAKLARQHTLRSKAEQAKRDKELSNGTGEPTWDNNTQTRNGAPVLPSIESLTNGLSTLATSSPDGTVNGPEVLRVQPRSTQTVVHAVNVADHEYDSDDDVSSDGETMEDATITMARTRLSQETQGSTIETDEDFKARWGNTWIDRNAVPKKGILKQYHSYSEGQGNRQRSSSTAETHLTAGPLFTLPPSNPAQIDGLAHPHPQPSKGVNFDFQEDLESSTDSIGDFRSPPVQHAGQGPAGPGPIYSLPSHNSSAPALSLLTSDGRPRPPQAGRSMTAPARKRLNWAPECAVYSTYDAGTYDRRSEPATCNRLTPELAMAIKQELNAFKLEMPVHPQSRGYTHYFA